MIWQSVDGVAFRMAQPYDFSFLAQVGQVFRAFDDQDSGNLCFGVRKGEERFFVKFAGAPTVRAGCSPEEAVAALRASVPLYRDLAHENLIRLRDAHAVGGGYLAVFDWVDAVCMGKQYPQDRARFFELPLSVRRGIWVDILRFLIHVHERGYVAVDFYDGSVLYDPAQGKTVLCDIDLFQKKPYCNPMGRLWGSSRFMSPEEFTLGAPIDERTNVYTAGAMGFALLGGETDRGRAAWQAEEALFSIAQRAVHPDRAARWPTLRAMLEAISQIT